MKKSMVKRAQADEAALELGKVLGQSLAFGIVAGRCSAAQAAALRQARGEKIYRRFGLTWNQFCPKHLRMSGTQANEIVRLLEEFGPEYFENTGSVRISGDTYRLVAPFIQDKALRVDGEVLELNSANVQQVARSLRESQRALPPASGPAPETASAGVPILSDRLAAVDRHAAQLVNELRELAGDAREADRTPFFATLFCATLKRLRSELQRVSAENGAA
jgi:hypothetical protein